MTTIKSTPGATILPLAAATAQPAQPAPFAAEAPPSADVSGFSVVSHALMPSGCLSAPHSLALTPEEAADLDLDVAMICASVKRDAVMQDMMKEFGRNYVDHALAVVDPLQRKLLESAQGMSAEFAFDLARTLLHRQRSHA